MADANRSSTIPDPGAIDLASGSHPSAGQALSALASETAFTAPQETIDPFSVDDHGFPFSHLPMPVLPYGGQASIYDYEYRNYTEDIPFYLARFDEYAVKRSVLELGAGTGRLTFPLAEAGYAMVGIDISARMLRRARQRLKAATPEVARLTRFMSVDATRIALREQFDAVIAPFTFMCMLPDRETRLKCLQSAHRVLGPEGLLLLDLPRMRLPAESETRASLPRCAPFNRPPVYSFSLPPHNHIVDKYVHEHYDVDHNRLNVRYFFVERDYFAEKFFRRMEIRFSLVPVQETEIRELLDASGFELIQVYGNYRGEKLRHDSPRMIFECIRKTGI